MTKTNKSLLCALLATVLVLTCALALLPVALPTSANAASDVYELVTDASTLKVGDEIVIATTTLDAAMSSTQGDNNRSQTKITAVGDNSISITTDVQVLTLQAGAKDGTFAFYTGNGYLYAASSSKNYLRTEKTLSNNSSWTIEIAEKGVATVTAQGTNTRNLIKYNSSSKIFSCYASGQQSVVICRKVVASSNPVTVTINGVAQEGNMVDNDQYSLSVVGVGDKGLVVGGQYKATLQLKSGDLTVTLKANGTEIESGKTYDIGETTTLAFTVEVQQNTCEHTNKTFVPVSKSTCQTKGNETAYYHCDDCGHNFADEAMTMPFTPVELPLADHNFVVDAENSYAATCIMDGQEVKKCTTEGCTEIKETVIPALGHDFDESGKCKVCGLTLPDSVEITYDDFSTKSYADNNGTKDIKDILITINQVMNQSDKIQFQKDKGYLILNNVTLHSIKIDAASASGMVVSVYDTAEDAVSGKGTAVEAVDGVYTLNAVNKYVRIAQKSTTLKLDKIEIVYRAHEHSYETKYDEINHWEECACGDIINEAKHVWTEESSTAPTCTAEGKKVYKCVCGATKTETIAKTEHDWDYENGTETTAPTCTEDGVKTIHCKDCDETKTQPVRAIGHSYSETSRTESTCVVNGSVTETCANCGDVQTTTLELDSTNHQHIVVDAAVAATCTTEGKTEGTHCQDCNAVVEAQTVIPVDPNAHDWDIPQHVDGTETHRYVCKNNAEHTRDEDCIYDGNLCTKCSAAKPTVSEKQFVVTETIEASDGTVAKDGKLYVKAGSRIVVKYVITANSGVSALEATLKANANFRFVSMTAGVLDNADITVTGTDVAADVKKAVVTAKAGGFTQTDVVLLTVVYQLTEGATIDESMAFGIDLQVCYQGNVVSAEGVEVVGNNAKFAERSVDLPTITVNGKTSAEELHFTYNGQNVTADKFAVAGRSDVPAVTWTEVNNAGTYTLVLKFADNGTYGEQTATFTVVIDKVVLAAGDFSIAVKDGVNLTKKT